VDSKTFIDDTLSVEADRKIRRHGELHYLAAAIGEPVDRNDRVAPSISSEPRLRATWI